MSRPDVILCVDDEKNILKGLERTLRMDGYKILTALSGAEGLEILKKEKVDLIIADQRMPEMTGSEFLRIVREKYPHIIRIMLSGYSDFEGLVQAINEGEIFRFLSKPWSDKELKDCITNALDQKKVITIVEDLIGSVCQVIKLAENVSVDVLEDQSRINLKIKGQEAISKDIIFQFLDLLFDNLGVRKEASLRAASGAITKREGKIVIAVDIGKGVILQIELPNIEAV